MLESAGSLSATEALNATAAVNSEAHQSKVAVHPTVGRSRGTFQWAAGV